MQGIWSAYKCQLAENERLLARHKDILVEGHAAGSSVGAKTGRDKATAGLTLVDLKIIEYLDFILSHPTIKEPLTN